MADARAESHYVLRAAPRLRSLIRAHRPSLSPGDQADLPSASRAPTLCNVRPGGPFLDLAVRACRVHIRKPRQAADSGQPASQQASGPPAPGSIRIKLARASRGLACHTLVSHVTSTCHNRLRDASASRKPAIVSGHISAPKSHHRCPNESPSSAFDIRSANGSAACSIRANSAGTT